MHAHKCSTRLVESTLRVHPLCFVFGVGRSAGVSKKLFSMCTAEVEARLDKMPERTQAVIMAGGEGENPDRLFTFFLGAFVSPHARPVSRRRELRLNAIVN